MQLMQNMGPYNYVNNETASEMQKVYANLVPWAIEPQGDPDHTMTKSLVLDETRDELIDNNFVETFIAIRRGMGI